MNWKEFLKLEFKKLFITLFFLLVLGATIMTQRPDFFLQSPQHIIFLVIYYPFFLTGPIKSTMVTLDLVDIVYDYSKFPFAFVMVTGYLYLVSCLIVWIYDKFRGRK